MCDPMIQTPRMALKKSSSLARANYTPPPQNAAMQILQGKPPSKGATPSKVPAKGAKKKSRSPIFRKGINRLIIDSKGGAGISIPQ